MAEIGDGAMAAQCPGRPLTPTLNVTIDEGQYLRARVSYVVEALRPSGVPIIS